jgi:hypothetical protein
MMPYVAPTFALALMQILPFTLSSPTLAPPMLPRAEINAKTKSSIGLETHLNPGLDCKGAANGGSDQVTLGVNTPT